MAIDFPSFQAVKAQWFDDSVSGYDSRKICGLSIDGGGKQIWTRGNSTSSEGLDYGLTLRNFIRRPVLERHLGHEILTSFIVQNIYGQVPRSGNDTSQQRASSLMPRQEMLRKHS